MFNRIISLFTVLLGRIPAWVPVAAFFTARIDAYAFIFIYASVVAAKLLLYMYETGRPTLISSIHTMWRYIYKPLLYILIAEITVYGLLYMFFRGTKLDWTLGLAALFFLTCAWVAGMFVRSKKLPAPEGALKKNIPVRVIIAFLWLYVVFSNDYALFKSMALVLIYVFEYFTLYNPERESIA